METGQAYAYSIDKLQDRGAFYIESGVNVYAGQVIGEHIRQNDLVVNVCKSKKLSNMRASGSDEKMRIAPPIKLSLEEYMEAINKDEYLEITPHSLRLRKILLDEIERKRAGKTNE
jgi:GTP-binding protein